MDYRKKKYYAVYVDTGSRFSSLKFYEQYSDLKLKVRDPYAAFRHLNPDPWKYYDKKHIKGLCGFDPNHVVSIDVDKNDKFVEYLNNTKGILHWIELTKENLGQ